MTDDAASTERVRFYLRTRERVEIGELYRTRAAAEYALGISAGWRVVPDDEPALDYPYISPSDCEVADLQRDDDRTTVEIERDALHDKLAAAKAEVERLKSELRVHRTDMPDETNWHGVVQGLSEARAELARMRPVVEAAEAWRRPNPDGFGVRMRALEDAVDAFRAG